MATSREDIKRWFKDAKKNPAHTHLVIVCDSYDHDDYPVPCKSKAAAEALIAKPGSMQRVMEVYDLNMDMEQQLNQQRSWNL